MKNPGELYHGTSLSNLQNILKDGKMSAGKGYSPHRTKTKEALFWTTDPENALIYATANVDDPIILQLKVFPRDLAPDVDDAGDLLSVDLMELQEYFNKHGEDEIVELGMTLTERQEYLLDKFADHSGYSERATPCSLYAESGRLYAYPWVMNGVDMSAYSECPEHYDDDSEIIWDDGSAFMLSKQYMTFQEIPLDWLIIWAPRNVFRHLGKVIPKRAADRMTLLDYSDAKCQRLNLFKKRVFYRVR